MNIIVVDDDEITLANQSALMKQALPYAEVCSFKDPKEALSYAEQNQIHIALLDITLEGMSGLDLAEVLRRMQPKLNIMMCTVHKNTDYALKAHELFCSDYIIKPLTEERLKRALDHLRYPSTENHEGLKAQCFGNFEVYYNGKVIVFGRKKTQELFAYLIDRRGALVSTSDIGNALYETPGKESFIRNMRSDLSKTFERLGCSDALIKKGKNLGVDMEKIKCDFYEYLKGKKNLFYGEYMAQYTFAEPTLAWLIKDKNKT